MLWWRAPKHLWDDCLELEAFIRSNIAHGIYKTDGQVLKPMMSGEVTDISQCSVQEWFECIMFYDETAPFPDDVLKSGHYLGSIIDVGPAITTKNLTKNGKVLNSSMYRPLTPDRIADNDK